MSAATQDTARAAVARLQSRARHADAGVVTEMARSLRREARGERERERDGQRERALSCAIEAARGRRLGARRRVTGPTRLSAPLA